MASNYEHLTTEEKLVMYRSGMQNVYDILKEIECDLLDSNYNDKGINSSTIRIFKELLDAIKIYIPNKK